MGSAASVHEKAREMNYYEILQVEKTATDADLKKAYRKQALLLHPDRNHGNVEEATAKFAVVQAAYDVLSDSQERAWYDSHGMSMGGGGSGGSGEDGVHIYTTTEDVMRWFDPLMFANVDPESSSNFWATASSIFNQLAQEEREAAMDADVDSLFFQHLETASLAGSMRLEFSTTTGSTSPLSSRWPTRTCIERRMPLIDESRELCRDTTRRLVMLQKGVQRCRASFCSIHQKARSTSQAPGSTGQGGFSQWR